MKDKSIAKESDKVIKARKKIELEFSNLEKKINEIALEKTKSSINQWISKYSNERVVLKNKNITLFDENQNAAKISKFIVKTSMKIQNKFNLESIKDNFFSKKIYPINANLNKNNN